MADFLSLPPELSEQIILNTSGLTLVAFCGTSSFYRSLCSGLAFWRKKFAYDGLPLFHVGHNNTHRWIRIYQRALKIDRKAEIAVNEINSDRLILRAAIYGIVSTCLDDLKEVSPKNIEEFLANKTKDNQSPIYSLLRDRATIYIYLDEEGLLIPISLESLMKQNLYSRRKSRRFHFTSIEFFSKDGQILYSLFGRKEKKMWAFHFTISPADLKLFLYPLFFWDLRYVRFQYKKAESLN